MQRVTLLFRWAPSRKSKKKKILYRYGQMLSYIDNNSIEYADRNILHSVHGVDICAYTCKFNDINDIRIRLIRTGFELTLLGHWSHNSLAFCLVP